jgi:hypothetical protein
MRATTLILLPLGFALVFAITPLRSSAQSATPDVPQGAIHQSIVLTPGVKQKLFFAIQALGSVKGQVLISAPDMTGDTKGINGIKVTLRSRDSPYKHWFWEQHTDEAGNYLFENLRPGKYTIEIDPADVPTALTGVNDISRVRTVGVPWAGVQTDNVSLRTLGRRAFDRINQGRDLTGSTV